MYTANRGSLRLPPSALVSGSDAPPPLTLPPDRTPRHSATAQSQPRSPQQQDTYENNSQRQQVPYVEQSYPERIMANTRDSIGMVSAFVSSLLQSPRGEKSNRTGSSPARNGDQGPHTDAGLSPQTHPASYSYNHHAVSPVAPGRPSALVGGRQRSGVLSRTVSGASIPPSSAPMFPSTPAIQPPHIPHPNDRAASQRGVGGEPRQSMGASSHQSQQAAAPPQITYNFFYQMPPNTAVPPAKQANVQPGSQQQSTYLWQPPRLSYSDSSQVDISTAANGGGGGRSMVELAQPSSSRRVAKKRLAEETSSCSGAPPKTGEAAAKAPRRAAETAVSTTAANPPVKKSAKARDDDDSDPDQHDAPPPNPDIVKRQAVKAVESKAADPLKSGPPAKLSTGKAEDAPATFVSSGFVKKGPAANFVEDSGFVDSEETDCNKKTNATASASTPPNPFSFGGPPAATATASKKDDPKPAFDATKADDQAKAPSTFSFGATKDAVVAKPPSTFSFGGSATTGAPQSSTAEDKKETAPPTFSFGGKAPSAPITGQADAQAKVDPAPAHKGPAPFVSAGFVKAGPAANFIEDDGFASGADSDDGKKEKEPAPAAPSSKSPNPFSFGPPISVAEGKNEAAGKTATFTFGGQSKDEPSSAKPVSSPFSFGSKVDAAQESMPVAAKPSPTVEDKKDAASAPAFSFGGKAPSAPTSGKHEANPAPVDKGPAPFVSAGFVKAGQAASFIEDDGFASGADSGEDEDKAKKNKPSTAGAPSDKKQPNPFSFGGPSASTTPVAQASTPNPFSFGATGNDDQPKSPFTFGSTAPAKPLSDSSNPFSFTAAVKEASPTEPKPSAFASASKPEGAGSNPFGAFSFGK